MRGRRKKSKRERERERERERDETKEIEKRGRDKAASSPSSRGVSLPMDFQAFSSRRAFHVLTEHLPWLHVFTFLRIPHGIRERERERASERERDIGMKQKRSRREGEIKRIFTFLWCLPSRGLPRVRLFWPSIFMASRLHLESHVELEERER